MPLTVVSAGKWTKVNAANSTDTAFAAPAPTTTAPSGDGALDMIRGGNVTAPELLLMFYGVGADNDTFSARVYGWHLIDDLYMPMILCEVSCTLCTVVGVATEAVLNTERLVDTITLTYGNVENTNVMSPANNIPGYLVTKTRGCPIITVKFDLTGATEANALWVGTGT